jgi:hypothetical protein
MTALNLLAPRERARLLERLAELRGTDRLMREAGGLAGTPEPPPLHRLGVTGLAVTPAGSQGGLAAPSRAVPGIGPCRGERPPAASARLPAGAGEPFLHLPAQAPDGRLGGPQLGDHPRLDDHVAAEVGEGHRDADGENHIAQPFLRGLDSHVTTIAVTREPGTLAAPREDREDAIERTTR